jgi:acyl-coenzyme A thioesterase PaaI-like protein
MNAAGGADQAFTIGILADLDENLAHCRLDSVRARVAGTTPVTFTDLAFDLLDDAAHVVWQGAIHRPIVARVHSVPMGEQSLQERYAPETICFGCGPANPAGLHVSSFPAGGEGAGEVVAEWTPGPNHEAFPGVLNGGIIGTLLDCHCNWTAAYHLMRRLGRDRPPTTVTADYHITLQQPTPTDGPVRLRARVVDSTDRRAIVEGTLEAAGKVTASCRGTFVAVGPGHPAYERW